MSWILHASDPHLGDISPGQKLDDDKGELDQPDLETTQRVFVRTLKNLRSYVDQHGRPDVAVISGDLAYRADDSGFGAFKDLLTEAADVLPSSRSRIVVVPGNHDVVWTADPGSRKRYAGFLGATRQQRCCTPLIDGIDFDRDTGALLPAHAKSKHLVATDDVLVVPINSSNWCGATVTPRGGMPLTAWDAELAGRTADDRKRLLGELARLYRQDVARVSSQQVEALGRHLRDCGIPRDRDHDPRVRIAVLHHQLLPVSTREERKAYEAIMNLGAVRRTLAEYGFDLVLHGHKHESSMYWDLAAANPGDLNAPRRRMLVLSSPGHFDVDDPVMRAIHIEGPRLARNARIRTFLGAGPHRSKAQHDVGQLVPLWPADTDRREQTTVVAATAHAAYARLRSLYQLRDRQELRNVVCQVDDPSDAATLPPDYPEVAVAEPQAWFDDLVTWWQRDRSELVEQGLLGFNHGERIRRRWGNQIERAIEVLNARQQSSRALVQLVAPRETGRYKHDDRALSRGPFPAFVLAEFSLAERDGERHLDCFGYFRKQEMQYWWPVNLAELARLQEVVRVGIDPPASTGRIVTFAAVALWGRTLPRVAVPMLDLLVEEPKRLLSMAVAAAFPAAADSEAVSDWRHVLRDLAGTGRDAPPKVSAGADVLLDDLRRLAVASPTTKLKAVITALDDLADIYRQHADRSELPAAAVSTTRKRVDGLATAVKRVLPEAVK